MIESKSVTYRRLPQYKYQTMEPLVFLTDIFPAEEIAHEFFHLGTDGVLSVATGYKWDGPSGPAIDTKNFMRGSLAHDVLFQAHQLFPDKMPDNWRERANRLLVRICREDGMSAIRAWWVYQGVDKFGHGRPRDLNPYNEVLIAP